MKCKRCLGEIEFEFESVDFFNYGLRVEGNLCQTCLDELKDLLDKFFRETQIMNLTFSHNNAY